MAFDNRDLLVIIGITGNQGGSVARTFSNNPELVSRYRLRGISRQSSSPRVNELRAKGVEMVVADLHDPSSLVKAFEGAKVIFSVTDFWKPFLDPENQVKAQERGKSIGQLAYELEYEQGRNIADAASKTVGLERFVVSMLCSTKKCSNGQYDKIYHFDSKADMITYIKSTYPTLAAKMSELNMGVFMQSWRFVTALMGPYKLPDRSFILRLPCDPDTPVPLVDPTTDTGPFVEALLAKEPGIQLYGETSLISWNQWVKIWGEILGQDIRFERVSVEWCEEEIGKNFPRGFGTEIAEMFEFMGIYGYDGGDPACLRKEELGVDRAGLSSVEKFVKDEDWSILGV